MVGWLPYVTYEPADTIPTTFVDASVRPGQTYTYNLIGETRGATFTILNGDSAAVVGGEYVCLKNCRLETLELAPVLFHSLTASTGEPNVGRVYLPVSRQAGATAATAAVTASTGPVSASPALAQANLGVGVSSGHDLGKEAGGITLMRGDLGLILHFLKLATRVNKKIRQNLVFSGLYNFIAIPIAMTGLLNPLIAVAAMLLSSLTVIGNTLLLIKRTR